MKKGKSERGRSPLKHTKIGTETCRRCGSRFALHPQTLETAKTSAETEQRPGAAYCPACRPQLFAERLLGETVERTERRPAAAARIPDPLRAVREDSRLGTTVYKSQCFICNQGCDALVHVKEGTVVRIEGDRGSEVTKGTLCSKGLASRHILYHPNRLLYPLKRMGARGEGKWKRITWDEAFTTIVERLRDIEECYGSESIVLATGTNRGWVRYFMRFTSAYGKQWIGPGIAQCFYPRIIGQMMVFGTSPMENPHYDSTSCMIVWGCNPANTWPAKAVGMMEARSRGARMIVIDPLLSETASKADLWLQLRPGTDAALALGMLHVIIGEGLFDREFVERWCVGFEELRRRALDYSPERVEAITWVPAAMIREAARLYATTRPSSITQCLSIDQNADTISTSRSIGMLAAITGNIDVPGGNVLTMLAGVTPRPQEAAWLTKEQHQKRLGNKEYPLLSGEPCPMTPSAHNHAVFNAILTGEPYAVKAIYCHGSNMLLSYANTPMVAEAIRRLDFLVAADLFPTETVQMADIVLPAASWMERDSVTQNEQTSADHFHLQQKTVRLGECRSDPEILNELSKRLGLGDRMFPSEEAYFDFLLAPSGQTFKEFRSKGGASFPMTFRKYERTGFRTPSGKVELYSRRLEALGFDGLPAFREPDESPVSTPELAKEYPLIMTTGGRAAVFRHSELRNISLLREIVPELLVSIHPFTAAEAAIAEGDVVIVETRRGRMEARAHVTPGIDPRVVQVPSHWPGINNVNLITDNEHCAPMIGSAQLRCQLCRVKRR